MNTQQTVFSQRTQYPERVQQSVDTTKNPERTEKVKNFFKNSWDFLRNLTPEDVVSYTTKRKSAADVKREAEEAEAAKLAEQRAYDERLAAEERERLERLRKEEIERTERREDTAIRRLVADAMAAGISPEHVLGGGGSVSYAAPQGVTTQSADMLTPEEEGNLGDMIKSLLPMLLLIVTRGRVKAPAAAAASGSYLSQSVSRFT